MSLKNTHSHYGSVTKTFHWLTALLILTAIPLGLIANQLPYDSSDQLAFKALVFSLHKTVGIAAFFVALARILWALTQVKPGLLNSDKPLETGLAEVVHWLLYGSLVLAPLTGWVHHAASEGFAPIWWPFGQSLPLVAKDASVSALFAGLHIVFTWVLMGSIGLHIAGALKHHVIDKDATLRRMLPGRSDPPETAPHDGSARPFVAALVIWAAALGVGSYAGVFHSHSAPTPEAVVLDAVQSDWAVTEGTLDITVTQLGSSVEGRFADWTAAISFEERDAPGPAGSVNVTIAIPSLTLGSVTGQALGADFFAADSFPTAQFTADLVREDAGYVANGTLSIREASVPVSMPFTLAITEGIATASGTLTVNRLDFGIGVTYPDESSVGFGVDIRFALTATQED